MDVTYNTFSIILCVIVFLVLTVFFVVLIHHILKLRLKAIAGGLYDEEILKQKKTVDVKKNKTKQIISEILSFALCIAIVGVFAFSLSSRLKENDQVGNIPVSKVIRSGSMSKKHENNTYLVTNHLDNQFQKFDLVFIEQLPEEEDLKLYDIVVYEREGYLIIHRIIQITPPSKEYPKTRYLFKGDANENPDRFPVYYENMRGIYRGNRVPYVGSFVDFMNCPAGYLCLLLIVFVTFVAPALDRKLEKAWDDRHFLIATNTMDASVELSENLSLKEAIRSTFEQNHSENQTYIKVNQSSHKYGFHSADAYYQIKDNKKTCFAYLYEDKEGINIRFLGNNNLMEKYIGAERTSYPRSKNDKWYLLKMLNSTPRGAIIENLSNILGDSLEMKCLSEEGSK